VMPTDNLRKAGLGLDRRLPANEKRALGLGPKRTVALDEPPSRMPAKPERNRDALPKRLRFTCCQRLGDYATVGTKLINVVDARFSFWVDGYLRTISQRSMRRRHPSDHGPRVHRRVIMGGK